MTLQKKAANNQISLLTEGSRQLLKKLESRPQGEVMNSEALRLVRSVWPAAFHVSSPQPLKIGIHKDMENTNLIPAHIISVALRFFTSLERYLESIKPKAVRIDLYGQEAGDVKLREAVDAEIKLFHMSGDSRVQGSRTRIIIKKIRLLAVKKTK